MQNNTGYHRISHIFAHTLPFCLHLFLLLMFSLSQTITGVKPQRVTVALEGIEQTITSAYNAYKMTKHNNIEITKYWRLEESYSAYNSSCFSLKIRCISWGSFSVRVSPNEGVMMDDIGAVPVYDSHTPLDRCCMCVHFDVVVPENQCSIIVPSAMLSIFPICGHSLWNSGRYTATICPVVIEGWGLCCLFPRWTFRM